MITKESNAVDNSMQDSSPKESAIAAQKLRVVSINVNGLRSATSKGFFEWVEASGADVICMQETRLQSHQWLDEHKPAGWHMHLCPAEKAGYAGTAIYSRLPFESVTNGLSFDVCDTQGRFTAATFKKPDGSEFIVASLYLPSGSSGDEAQARKDSFLIDFLEKLKAWRAANKSIIICGDYNIVHKKIDIKNWTGNQKNSGVLPHERAWLDTIYEELGYVDAFRVKNQNAEEYSWWSNRGQAWANNVGWRIDYHVVSPDWKDKVHEVSIYRDKRFSDHSPVIIDYLL